MSRRWPLAVVTLLFVACGAAPSRTPAGGKVSCHSDSDCVVTTSFGCCSCCPSPPRAIPRAEAERQTAACASKDCEACSASITCPGIARVSDFEASCREGTCAALAIAH